VAGQPERSRQRSCRQREGVFSRPFSPALFSLAGLQLDYISLCRAFSAFATLSRARFSVDSFRRQQPLRHAGIFRHGSRFLPIRRGR